MKFFTSLLVAIIFPTLIYAQKTINLKLFFEGPFEATEMNTLLNDSDSIPLLQPYYEAPWLYSVADQVDSIPNENVVDWMLIEILQLKVIDGDTAFDLLDRKPAFLLKNGTVTELDGSGMLVFSELLVPEFHVKVIHRNHLPVISSTTLTETGGIYNYDFSTDASKAIGDVHSLNEVAPGKWAMIAGDGSGDGQVDNQDKDEVWHNMQDSVGYYTADYNLDGVVDEDDLSLRWDVNSGKGVELPVNAERFICGDSLIDYRNGIAYGTIEIDDQCWMTSNLSLGNMITGGTNQTDNNMLEMYCYDNDTNNCIAFGGLYQWEEMMQYDTLEQNQGICPEGWHLPSSTEWQNLITFLGGETVAGGELVSGGPSGFKALMNGQYNQTGGFNQINNLSTFWTAKSTTGNTAIAFNIQDGDPAINSQSAPTTSAYGVRCLKGLPNRPDTSLKVIDTLVYQLISDSLEIAQGIYRYDVIGKQKSNDIIVANNLIVGDVDKGYLREVDSVSNTGSEMTLYTSEATLEDAFEEGEFDFSSNINSNNKGPVYSYTKVLYLADGVTIGPTEAGLQYDFNGTVLYEDDNVSATISQGHVLLDPNFNFEFKFKNKKVKKLAFYADETVFENSLDLQLDVTGAYSYEHEKLLAKVEKHVIYVTPSVPPVPVVIVITTSLKSNIEFDFDAEFSATTGYTNDNILSFGIAYNEGNWNEKWDLSKSTSIHPFVWNGEVNLDQNLQLKPEISFEIYGVAGPNFSLPLWEALNANLTLPEMDYDASLDVGLNGNLGADISVFGKSLLGFNKQLLGFEQNLYSSPSQLSMVSGNDQTGTINQQLADPIVVNVTDVIGEHYIPAMVHFSVVSGNGTLSETDVWTDADGDAQTFWTLGDLAGTQEIKAEVKKANGEHIANSPLTITAYADTSNNCPPTVTDIDGNTYNTVQIGTQCWMKENLKTTKYRNGTPIPNETVSYYWENLFSGAYVWHSNDISLKNIYGALYNWYSTVDPNGLCPSGWHVPTNDEWTTLKDYIGGTNSPHGDELKSCRQVNSPLNGNCNTSEHPRWNEHNWYWGTDDYGFSGLPGGYRFPYGYFSDVGYNGVWWSSTENLSDSAWSSGLNYSFGYINESSGSKNYGFSVRCLRD